MARILYRNFVNDTLQDFYGECGGKQVFLFGKNHSVITLNKMISTGVDLSINAILDNDENRRGDIYT